MIDNGCQAYRRRQPQASEFHCLIGPSQLRRLGPMRPRNTNIVAVVPRAARAFGAACPGLVCFALSALLPLRGQGNGHAWRCTKLYGSIIHDSYETRCRKGRRKSRPDGWAAAGRGFPANCPRCFPHRGGYLPITSRGRGVGVSPTPTRRLMKPSSSSTPTVPSPSSPPARAVRTEAGSRCYSGPSMTDRLPGAMPPGRRRSQDACRRAGCGPSSFRSQKKSPLVII